MEFNGTIERIVTWKSQKGQFFEFVERPEHFWKWGLSSAQEGEKVRVLATEERLGRSDANLKIDELIRAGEKQVRFDAEGIREDSTIAEAQRSTGAVLKTAVRPAAERSEDFFLHEAIAKQAERIIALERRAKAAEENIELVRANLKTAFQRLEALQNHCKVSFV